MSDEPLLVPKGDGTFRMTAACHRLMMGALLRSTKLLYTLERPALNTKDKPNG